MCVRAFFSLSLITQHLIDSLSHTKEGGGREVLSASVELIFDNSDHRFPADRDVVSIKRTVGTKKDEYFVNQVHSSKSDVAQLLESAGIGRGHSFNMVEQGQITKLAMLQPQERFTLLQEVAGTSIYEQRKLESLRTMRETDGRLRQVDEVLTFLSDRLQELEQQSEELREYHRLDKKRKQCEFAFYTMERDDAERKVCCVFFVGK